MEIKQGQSREFKVGNRGLIGVWLTFDMIAAAAGTAMATGGNNIVNMEKVQVAIHLYRAGRKFTLAKNNLRILFGYSSLMLPGFEYLKDQDKLMVTQANATSVKEKGIIPAFVMFDSPIVLQGAEELGIEVDYQDDANHSSVDDSNSYLRISTMDAIGVERRTPYIKSKMIAAGEDQLDEHLGNNVEKIVFLNFDKNDILAANRPFSSVTLVSDKISWTKKAEHLYAERANIFGLDSTSDLREHCHLIHSGMPLNNTKLSMALNGSNINNTENYIVYGQYYTDAKLVNRAEKMEAKHLKRNIRAIGTN